MNPESVLDDYLGELLAEAVPEPAAAALPAAAAITTIIEPTAPQEPAEVVAPAPLPDTAPHVPTVDAPTDEPAPPENQREPTWDDLPDEVIYETSAAHGATLANADTPTLEAAFEAAIEGLPPIATPSALEPARPAPLPTQLPPAAAPTRAPAPRPTDSDHVNLAASRPTTWQDLQAQAQLPPNSGDRQQQRRATERSSRWLRLRCGQQAYALELLKVQEVVLPVPLLPLRGTAAAMLGIMNLRGQVVPVIDLGLHLGAAATGNDAQTRIVVLEEHGEIMGLRVSAVDDVTNIADSQIEPPDTARICRISNDVFRGVARLQQRPIILLDAARLLGGP